MRHFFFSIPAQLATTALLLLVAAGLYLGPISEERQIAQDQKSRIDDEALVILAMEKEVARVSRIVQHMEANTHEIEAFRNKYLIQKDQRVVAISKFLHEAAAQNNLKPQQITYQTSRSSRQKQVEIYQIHFPIHGHYRDIRQFISDIETSDMFLIIQEMAVEDEAAGGAVLVDLVLATYFEGER